MLLQDDPLVDVFLFLCRAVLDALEITNRRLNGLVHKRTKGVCLRVFEEAYLVADAAVARMPVSSRLVTAPAMHRDGGLQSETFTAGKMPLEELSRWFVNRLRHSVVTGQLGLAVPTDSPDLVECIQGTVLLKKGLWWGVRQAIGLDNARKFLSSFTGLSELKISVDEERFRFTDDWFKLFESMALYRLKLHSDVSAGVEALISFLFGASSSPGSGNRLLQATFEWNDTKTLKAAVKQLFEAAMSCTSIHNTTLLVDDLDWDDIIELIRLLKKYEGLPDYSTENTDLVSDDDDSDHKKRVFDFRKEGFRIQLFLQTSCSAGSFQLRRAPAEKVENGFWYRTDADSDVEYEDSDDEDE